MLCLLHSSQARPYLPKLLSHWILLGAVFMVVVFRYIFKLEWIKQWLPIFSTSGFRTTSFQIHPGWEVICLFIYIYIYILLIYFRIWYLNHFFFWINFLDFCWEKSYKEWIITGLEEILSQHKKILLILLSVKS